MGKTSFDPPEGLEELVFLKAQTERLARGDFTKHMRINPTILEDKKQEEVLTELRTVNKNLDNLKADQGTQKTKLPLFVEFLVIPMVVSVISGIILWYFQLLPSFIVEWLELIASFIFKSGLQTV